MKLSHWIIGAWLLAALTLATFSFPIYLTRGVGFDFGLRINEVQNVIRGIDPYDIFSGKIHSDEYYPLNRLDLSTEIRNKPIHAYPPWSYTYFLPFAGNGSTLTKWRIWCACDFLFFVIVIAYSYWRGKRLRGNVWDALLVVAASLSIGLIYGPNFGNGNYSMALAALLPALVVCLEKRWDILAGICWALLMVKPQDGFLLAIPILLSQRWKTVITAVVTCLAAGEISALLIGKPLIQLILQIPDQGCPYFHGTFLLPECLYNTLLSCGLPRMVILYSNMLVGVLICVLMGLLVRKADDWLVKIVPPAICASAWTYLMWGDHSIFFVAQIIFAERFILSTDIRKKAFYLGMIALVFLSSISALSMCTDLISVAGTAIGVPNLFDLIIPSVYLVENICGFLLIVGTFAWCMAENRRLALAESNINVP